MSTSALTLLTFWRNFLITVLIPFARRPVKSDMFRGSAYKEHSSPTIFGVLLVFVVLPLFWYAGCILHTRQSSTQNNKYQVSHKHSCFSWWWTPSRPKHVEIDKYTKNKYTKKQLCTKLAVLTRLCRDAQSTKQQITI